jgi:hypothetical protein
MKHEHAHVFGGGTLLGCGHRHRMRSHRDEFCEDHDIFSSRNVNGPIVRRSQATRQCAGACGPRRAVGRDVRSGGDLLLFDALGFKTVTPYRAVDGKRYAFALRPAGMTQARPLSSNTEDLKDGDFYTAIAMPGDGHGPLLRVVNDHLDSPAAGKARLRVVHAGTDAGIIDVRAAGASNVLFDDIEYQTVSDYKDVAPMNGQIEVVGAGPSAPIDATTTAHLEAGRFYTLVIVANTGADEMEASSKTR